MSIWCYCYHNQSIKVLPMTPLLIKTNTCWMDHVKGATVNSQCPFCYWRSFLCSRIWGILFCTCWIVVSVGSSEHIAQWAQNLTFTHWLLYSVYLCNCLLVQIGRQQITWGKPSSFRHGQDDLLNFKPTVRRLKEGDCIIEVQSTNLQQLCVVMFQLVKSMQCRLQAVLKAKGGPTQY